MTSSRRLAEYGGLAGYNFLAMTRRGFFYIFLLVYLREVYGLPVSFVALIGAVNATTSMLGQLLVWGRFSDRTDRRAGLMVTGELIAGLGYLATYGVYRLAPGPSAPYLTAGLVIACLGATEFFWSMTDVGYRAAIAQVTTTQNRGRFLGMIDLTGLIGMGLGLFLAGRLYRHGRGFTDGSLWFLAAAFILAGVPLIRITLHHLDHVTGPETVRETGGRLDPRFKRYMIGLAVAVIGLWCFQQNHNYFVRRPGAAAATDRDLAWIRTAFWVVAGLSAPLMGRWVDRVGARWAFPRALLLCALVPLSFVPTRSVLYAAVTLGLYGALLAAFRTASYALAAEYTPEGSRGRHFAVYNVVMSLGWGMAALLVGGPVADLAIASGASPRDGYALTFVVGSVLALAGLALHEGTIRRRD